MKKILSSVRSRVGQDRHDYQGPGVRVLTVAVLLFLAARTDGVTVADFGHGSMRVDGHLSINTRPLLLIVANYAGAPALADYDWELLIFSNSGLNGYFNEVSNGRFSWSRAGLLRVNFSAPDDRANRNTIEEMILEAQRQRDFDFRPFDADHNGVVAAHEMSILIIHNLNANSGQTRGVGITVPSPGSPIQVNVGVSGAAHTDTLMTFVHEVSHCLGTLDLYSGNNGLHGGISLMGPTSSPNSDRSSYHLDPWHKMVLGWSEPRIVSLRGNGRAVIPAAQLGHADAPVLLFDPLRGTDEFYLLEYRTNRASQGRFDANVAQQGLLIWHIWQKPDHSPVLTSPHTTLPFPAQTDWAYCRKCTGMFFRPGMASSRCPATGPHETYDNHTYSMVQNAPADPGQKSWKWCRKCQSMFFGGNASPTRCPADNAAHDGSQSGNYVMRFASQPMNGGQPGWRWCNKCQALFYGGSSLVAGVCPVSTQHDGTTSGEYRMHYDSYDVYNESAPTNSLGLASSWPYGALTPYSRWFSDASEVRVRYLPVRTLNSGNDLLVEWTSELPPPSLFTGETWVDFAAGPSGNGSFQAPFNSLGRAVGVAPFYSRIKLKPAWGNEPITIRQSVILEAPLGPVTID